MCERERAYASFSWCFVSLHQSKGNLFTLQCSEFPSNFPRDHSHLAMKMTVGVHVSVCVCVCVVSPVTSPPSFPFVIVEPLWTERLNNEKDCELRAHVCHRLCVFQRKRVDVCVFFVIVIVDADSNNTKCVL